MQTACEPKHAKYPQAMCNRRPGNSIIFIHEFTRAKELFPEHFLAVHGFNASVRLC